MKSTVLFLVAITSVFGLHSCQKESPKLRDGDLIFQTSTSQQSQAIQYATKSKYSHCGIIFIERGKPFVFEAVQPVKMTPLRVWIKRGKNAKYVVKRLRNADAVLTPTAISKMRVSGKAMAGRQYDLEFGWSDDKIYCSELIWKIYKRGAGVEIGQLQHLRDFDLSNPEVKAILKRRYGHSIPLGETVISPVAIFESDLLFTVKSE